MWDHLARGIVEYFISLASSTYFSIKSTRILENTPYPHFNCEPLFQSCTKHSNLLYKWLNVLHQSKYTSSDICLEILIPLDGNQKQTKKTLNEIHLNFWLRNKIVKVVSHSFISLFLISCGQWMMRWSAERDIELNTFNENDK